MRLHSRRALLGLTSALVATGLTLGATPAVAAGPQAESTATWLASGLRGGHLSTTFDGVEYPNWGTTLDAALAFQELGVRPQRRTNILDALEAEPAAYVGAPGATSAGALGKLMTAVLGEGLDPAGYAGGRLLTRLENRVVDGGAADGRAVDQGGTDYSNSITQSLVVRALALGGSGEAGDALAFLLKQQCGAGFFRVYLDSASGDFTCSGGTAAQSSPSVDATAFAVLALRVARAEGVGNRVQVTRALRRAGDWLARTQARNGSFRDGGVANANSTGLASWALAEVGRANRARLAARWVERLRVDRPVVRRTALGRADLGAVAYRRADLTRAAREGITDDVLFYWQSASAQALVALDRL